ncbi:MAG: DUF4445 domain-containing protein [Deltaproteobacteria bacterium]|nr:DUF4445 domain-containing protein [Deltaproteobacteria bacterium]
MPDLILKTTGGDRRLEFSPTQSLKEVLEANNCRVRSGCRGTGACGLCRVAVSSAEADEPTTAEQLYLSDDQILSGVRLACQVRPRQDMEVTILNPAPPSRWRTIIPAHGDHPYGRRTPAPSFPDLPKDIKRPHGLAIDLGTTHISLSFFDFSAGQWFTGRRGLNPQGVYGADVMTRLTAACESPRLAQDMRKQTIEAISDAVQDVATREGMGTEEIVKCLLVGNTAMLALLSGRNTPLLLQPAHWEHPIDCLPEDPEDLRRSWGIHPEALIEIPPPLAGFVGSDLLAGIVATGLVEAGPGSLLIDFGTNSEIALWDGNTLWVTSAAGGPAFEGCGLGCGIPAESGAIYQVKGSGLDLDFRTIDGAFPRGLCGSGIVDLIACLARSGILTPTGCFAPGFPQNGFVLPLQGPRLLLTKRDVDVFQRAKGAISAAVRVLLSLAGMGPRDLRHIYLGGAFGHFLDKANAAAVGLLPHGRAEFIHLCGNTALAGCESLLMTSDSVESLRRLTDRARIINLARNDEFEDFFLEGLYLSPWPDGA